MTQRGLYDRSVYDVLGFQKGSDPASPDTFVRRNQLRTNIISAAGAATPTTGKLLVLAMPLEGGDLVTSIGFVTGTTAIGTPTAGFVALYDPDGKLLGQSADFTSTAMAASTAFTKALATPTRAPRSGTHYVAWCATAGTMPTLIGSICAPPIATGEVSPARESTSATYTNAAPNTLPAMSNRLDLPYFVCV